MALTADEREKLRNIVDRLVTLRARRKELDEEVKAVLDGCWEKCGVKPKVAKQLAKEEGWDNIERLAQQQMEEQLDECRAALGLLADTPLGEAAQKAMADVDQPHPAFAANGYKKNRNGGNGKKRQLQTV